VAQLTKALACELAPHGIRVNAIAPGFIATPMTEATLADAAKTASLLAHVPMKRHGEADELAGPALFLCSEAASYVTGAILPVDGGYLAM
jgi:NAD(P)-dependent dehydrogenase (short-subunit alcohol dehydrogenase family)